MIPDELTAQVYQQVEELYLKAEARFARAFARPTIGFDLKGRSAGQAWLQQTALRFNRALLEAYPEDFVAQTVPHEVAHLLAHRLCGPGIRPHGREWQQLMTRLFAIPAKVRHDYSLPASSRYRFRYRCACRDQHLSATRHNRVLKGAEYRCRSCRQALVFIAEERAA